jgi:hypothetical protein
MNAASYEHKPDCTQGGSSAREIFGKNLKNPNKALPKKNSPRNKKSLLNVATTDNLGSVRGSVSLALATTSLLALSGATARAQALAPSALDLPAQDKKPVDDMVQIITSKSPQVITSKSAQVITSQSPQVVTKKQPSVIKSRPMTQAPAQTIVKEPARATYVGEPVRPIEKPVERQNASKTTWPFSRFSFKTPEGKKESVPVITHYYPKQIVYPFGRVDRHIDSRLMQAASIAEERARAHSRSMCWHYVKEALLASGVIDSRPKSELAREAAQDLVSNYGFKKLSVTDPFAAPIGSVLVYGSNHAAGHVELRTQDGFVSDFRSKTPSRRPLLGVYAKM